LDSTGFDSAGLDSTGLGSPMPDSVDFGAVDLDRGALS
jgi:hypothetical protein